jgi:hypothetical protein
LAVASYRVAFSGPAVAEDVLSSSASLSVSLGEGSWAIAVTGYDSAGTAVATGSAAAVVVRDETVNVSISLSPLASGSGNVDIIITWPAGISVLSGSASLDSAAVAPSALSFDAAGRSLRFASSLPTGNYLFVAALARSADTTYVSEAVQVSGNLTSAKTIALSAADFTQVPQAPASLTAAEALGGLSLAWTCDSPVETGFTVERSGDGGASWSALATLPANAASCQDSGAAQGQSYRYRVRSFNGIGSSAYSNTAAGSWAAPATSGSPVFGAPTQYSVQVGWTAASDDSTSPANMRYRLYRSASNNLGSVAAILANGVPVNDWSASTSVTATGLSASTLYYFNMLARDAAGNQSAYVPASVTTASAPSATQIIADHTVVDRYDDIPPAYLALVKSMWLDMPGESHSSGVRNGMRILETLNANYDSSVVESGTPESTASGLRVSRASWGDVSNASSWVYTYGEEDWYTSATAVSRTKAHIDYCNTHGLTIGALGFGWCWDMMWHNAPGGTVDPVHGVHWGGSSVGGPNGDLRWGLDSGDQALTGNSVSMDTYLSATQQYADYCASMGYPTKVFFSTGPIDTDDAGLTGESAAQREIKNDYIRAYVAADPNRILFDYADIVAWSDSGAENLVYWTDSLGAVHHVQMIHSDNNQGGGYAMEAVYDHIGQVGAMRLAKAAWWLMARIAGWDGN